MKILLFIPILIFFGSCSGSWLLKRAINKGIIVQSDTIIKEVITKGSTTHQVDTLEYFIQNIKTDTIVIESIKWKSKLHYDTISKTIYQQVECLPDTIRVPVEVNNEFKKAIESEFPFKWLFIAIIVVCVLIILLKILK